MKKYADKLEVVFLSPIKISDCHRNAMLLTGFVEHDAGLLISLESIQRSKK